MGKLITIKNFTIEIHDEEGCNRSCTSCHELCGIRSINKKAKTAEEFINNFVELNQSNGFYVGFDKYKSCNMDE